MNIRKKKLLVITGAGASVEFGMPSVSDVNHFLSAENEKYITIQGNNETLYDYIQKLQPTNDFEEVIFRFSQLQYILSDNYYYTDLIDINKLPHIYNSLLDYTGVLNSETLGMAVSLMHDKLVNKFREFSRNPHSTEKCNL